MKYRSAPAFRQALERRLPALSQETGRSTVRLRKEVAFDRLLARLVATAPDRWLLKGALALDYRFGSRARTTTDIDLATAGDEASATVDLLAAQAVDLGDFFAALCSAYLRTHRYQTAIDRMTKVVCQDVGQLASPMPTSARDSGRLAEPTMLIATG